MVKKSMQSGYVFVAAANTVNERARGLADSHLHITRGARTFEKLGYDGCFIRQIEGVEVARRGDRTVEAPYLGLIGRGHGRKPVDNMDVNSVAVQDTACARFSEIGQDPEVRSDCIQPRWETSAHRP